MADRQTIPGSCAANPEFRGSVRAEDGGQVFVYNGGLDFDETGEFVVSRGPNIVLEVIDASAMSAQRTTLIVHETTRRRSWPSTSGTTWAPRTSARAVPASRTCSST